MRQPAPLPSALLVILLFAAMPATPLAQSQTQKPSARPSTAKSAAPQTKPAPAKPAPAKPAAPERVTAPAPPPPQDVRYKTVYSTGDMKTESLTYVKGERERFEFQEMVLLRQHDQKRTIQISKSANTYLVSPEGAPPTPIMPGMPAAAPKPSGVIVYDYVLLAEVAELKASKPGAFGGLMKVASGVAAARGGAAGAAAGAAGAAAAPKENTESSIAVKLLQADGKQRLATTAKGKDGSGFRAQASTRPRSPRPT